MDRKDILRECYERCLIEMYEKSQPKGDYMKYVDMAKKGEITKDDLIYNRHYLNETQFNYIANKYKEAYRCTNEWESNCDFLIKCFEEGGFKTVYKPDMTGEKVRTAEKTSCLKDLIGEENAEKVITLIKELRDFYRFDNDEAKFNWNIYLGPSPTSNAETVKEYWKSQGVDLEIDETELTEDDYWELDEYGHLVED